MPEMLINGRSGHTISAQDRGLLYGDGLFETIKLIKGEPQHWSLHLKRLMHGAERLNIPMPDGELLLKELYSLSKAPIRPQSMPLRGARPQVPLSCQPLILAKVILTRGVGGRGYYPTELESTRIIQLFPWPELPAENAHQGVKVRICQLRIARQPTLAGLKHLNRLESVMARAEWQDSDIAEGLLQDYQGHFVEGTMSNLFLIKEGVLYTDPLDQCGVAGVMRTRILALAEQLEIPLRLTKIDEAMLLAADELFMSNAVIGIWPIREVIDKKAFAVGPICQQLQQALEE